MFDPSNHRIGETGTYEVLDAEASPIYLDDSEDTPWTITVASPGTKKAKRAEFKRQQAAQGALFTSIKGKKSGQDEMSETKSRADFLMEIVESTNADGLTYQGKTGLDALRAVFMDPYMEHVAIGLQNFYNDRGNFKTDASTISSNTSAT